MAENGNTKETALNAYNIPSITGKICLLHAVASFSNQETWTQAIKDGNDISWSGITIENVNHHFSEFEETQNVHVKRQRENIRLT